MEDTNICDKCGITLPSSDLVWIDSEDFKPLEKDNFNKTKYEEVLEMECFSALCEDCYYKLCCD